MKGIDVRVDVETCRKRKLRLDKALYALKQKQKQNDSTDIDPTKKLLRSLAKRTFILRFSPLHFMPSFDYYARYAPLSGLP